jgi:hypothetical protein
MENEKKLKKSKIFAGIAVGLLALTIMASCAGGNSDTSNKTDSTAPQSSDAVMSDTSSAATSQSADTSWIPKGFKVSAEDADLALAWDNSSTCSDLSTMGCAFIKIHVNKDCSTGITVEANEMDSDKNIVGQTYGSANTILKGQTAKVELSALDQNVTLYQITHVACY